MKKSNLIAIALLLFCFSVRAQRFSAGITAGFIASDIMGTDNYDFDVDFHKAGFIAGGFVSIPLNEKNTLQLELNYIQKGAEQLADSTGNGFFKFSFNYLEFPLIYKHRLQLNIGSKTIKNFGLDGGVAVARMITSDYTSDNYGVLDLNFINKTEVSVLAGLDYYFSSSFNFGFRYSNGIIPVIKQNAVPIGVLYHSFNYGNNMVLHFIFQYNFGNSKMKTNTGE